MSPSHSIHGSNNKIYNKSLLICCLILIVIFRPPNGNKHQEASVPCAFQRLPTAYYGSLLLLSLAFFVSFVGLVSSDSDTREKFSRFCSVYSFFCLAVLLFVSSIVFILPELEVPLWFEKQVNSAVAMLTEPFPLFCTLIVAMPFLHYLTPPPSTS